MKTLLRVIPIAVVLLVLLSSPLAAQQVSRIDLYPAEKLAKLDWQALGRDAEGDGTHASLPDARALSYALDPESGRLWFQRGQDRCKSANRRVPGGRKRQSAEGHG